MKSRTVAESGMNRRYLETKEPIRGIMTLLLSAQ